MKIRRVEVHDVAIPLVRPYTVAYETLSAVRNVIVAIHTDGPVGFGVASPSPYVTGESHADALDALGAAALLVGRDALALHANAAAVDQGLPAGRPTARAALDMALWDLFGKAIGRPIHALLGRAVGPLPTSVTIGIGDVAHTLDEARMFVGQGFTRLKVKLGHDLDVDLERLAKLIEAVPAGVRLRVDANQGYSAAELRRFAAATASMGLECIEQPLPADAVDAMRDMPAGVIDRCMADESLHGAGDALRLLRPTAAFGAFNIKLMKCGGPSAARAIVAVAEAAGLPLMWGCMDESCVGIAAALARAYATPRTALIDLDGSFDLARDPLQGGFVAQPGGVLVPSDAPGLGVALRD